MRSNLESLAKPPKFRGPSDEIAGWKHADLATEAVQPHPQPSPLPPGPPIPRPDPLPLPHPEPTPMPGPIESEPHDLT